ncbi:von Willebrand factor A domain-containing protein 8-like isoform X2 [Ornithodoros turicata]|uniref:von Willebrand factor A domain-containing protein 8-like isoform X2 n=1 Tax=Ornithodoros turicata TaxID=34597 RepID=UPI003139705B
MSVFVKLGSLVNFRKQHLIYFAHRARSRRYCYDTKITLGDVSMKTNKPKDAGLVPTKFLEESPAQSVLEHLRWIMQKDILGQDIFLIGVPGPYRRRIALQYLLTQREVEYVSLTRDTTESDLKQRREISNGVSHYIDQAAVKAAVEGRVLVLEGVEKAERNVLPVLNNLLENREMQLDDGRFLVSPTRYDKLLENFSRETLDEWKLVRVSENFRVFALGTSVPPYRGNPLDPPFRSRFQARDIRNAAYQEQARSLMDHCSKTEAKRLSDILSFAHSLLASKSSALTLPDFPIDNLDAAVALMEKFPSLPFPSVLSRIYPEEILTKEGKKAVTEALSMFSLSDSDNAASKIARIDAASSNKRNVVLSVAGIPHSIEVASGSSVKDPESTSAFVITPHHERLLAEMVQSHSLHDVCVIGSKGCGKSAVAKQFADLLGYEHELLLLYQDMGSRDLLQQRTTLPNGDTTWTETPLVTAALEGKLAVLDGIHRLHPSTLLQLQRLVQDRELQLFDGKRLLRHDRYDSIKSSSGLSDQDMESRKLYRIHPSFRIIALAEPTSAGHKLKQEKWLTPEVLPMFFFHSMRGMTLAEEKAIIEKMVGKFGANMATVLKVAHELRKSDDATLQSIAGSLSMRQLLRIARRFHKYPDISPVNAIYKACLARFLPPLAKQSLDRVLTNAGLPLESGLPPTDTVRCEVKDSTVYIGNTKIDVYQTGGSQVKVPDTLFYDNQQHARILEAMLQDFLLGEHLLLVGNQGVGKNKIVDRFLHLLNCPREYVQLHRDTSVQSLTLQPTVKDGVITYEDSPLVRAVQNGHVLVVDEADKAPTHVTCVLKALVESSEMLLADGRRIVHYSDAAKSKPNSVVMHPNFRMIVLANRPGFPFLGNDFFGSLGDIFSCHAIDNPLRESEMALLKQYGPSVPKEMVEKLLDIFGDLRSLADEGLITYPFSTREVVNIVKHLEAFPNDGITSVLKNVFDFDSYNKENRKLLLSVLHKHGIPVDASPENVQLARIFELPSPVWIGNWSVGKETCRLDCSVEMQDVHIKSPVGLPKITADLEKTEARSLHFSELQCYWSLPYGSSGSTLDMTISTSQDGKAENDMVHVAASYPLGIFSFSPKHTVSSFLQLQRCFPPGYSASSIRLAALGGSLHGCLAVHESLTNTLLLIDPETGDASSVGFGSLVQKAAEKFARSLYNPSLPSVLCKDLSAKSLIVIYQPGRNSFHVLDVEQRYALNWKLPVSIDQLFMADESNCIVVAGDTKRKYLLTWDEKDQLKSHSFSPITEEPADKSTVYEPRQVYKAAVDNLPLGTLGRITGPAVDANQAKVLMTEQDFASVAVGFPSATNDWKVYSFSRSEVPWGECTIEHSYKEPTTLTMAHSTVLVTSKPTICVPKEAWPSEGPPENSTGCLEVVNLSDQSVCYVPVPVSRGIPNFLRDDSDIQFVMDVGSQDTLVTVDNNGCVRSWELTPQKLKNSLSEWQKMIGTGQRLELKVEKKGEVKGPKHGKEDPENAPHVGGNTWAGGTGGRDTAGLGGIGGPYRLDKGHQVHQLSDIEKQSVPPEVLKAAHEMAQKALKDRLAEIQMSEHDAALYQQLSDPVKRQVQLLRVILDSLQATSQERQWLKHQTSGELDDSKLIESITGEKAIYRRRGEQEPEVGSPQTKPKRLRLVVDVSGSMYRFNGYDSRLQREMEAVLMAMEALQGFQNKFVYDILGHSGEESHLEFVKADRPPLNDKERLKVLQEMHAHSQFCLSGDNTLAATQEAIDTVVQDDCEEHFVIVLSDANLDRYAISPKKFADILTSNPEVDAFAVFIGSLGDQAVRLQRRLPSGRTFVCMDTADLPQILQQIFTSSLLRSAS